MQSTFNRAIVRLRSAYANSFSSAAIMWLMTSLCFSMLLYLCLHRGAWWQLYILTTLLTLPALIGLWLMLPVIKKTTSTALSSFLLLGAVVAIICLPYSVLLSNVGIRLFDRQLSFSYAMVILLACNIAGVLAAMNLLMRYFGHAITQKLHSSKSKIRNMNNYEQPQTSNRYLFKGMLTAGLILLLLIPSVFVYNLVEERQERFQEVAREVSGKWADSQTVSGPFISIPYTTTATDGKLKTITRSAVLILPDNMEVKTTMQKEERPRSIYKVLLYRSDNNFAGRFQQEILPGFVPEQLDLANARLCFALTDFKGIEEEASIVVNGKPLKLLPGLPQGTNFKNGLSVNFPLTPEQLLAGFDFSMNIKVKGSESLQYLPLAGSSKFSIASTWQSPSFSGNVLPGVREVQDSGFNAGWVFNRANLPFQTMVNAGDIHTDELEFGVNLVQPADNYAKTMRSVKYSILFIGLTFALFFIIEIMQKNPFHPVQYLLVGLALTIFYTLLVSIGEYLAFDLSYIISAIATIALISTYAKSHFCSVKTGLLFFGLLSILYGFIYVLISLEDTALLVGSIGLFVILALVMFASRKIQWYGPKAIEQPLENNYITS